MAGFVLEVRAGHRRALPDRPQADGDRLRPAPATPCSTRPWRAATSRGLGLRLLETCRRSANNSVYLECADAEVLRKGSSRSSATPSSTTCPTWTPPSASSTACSSPGSASSRASPACAGAGHGAGERLANLGVEAYARLGGRLGTQGGAAHLPRHRHSEEEDHELQELDASWTSTPFPAGRAVPMAKAAGFRVARCETGGAGGERPGLGHPHRRGSVSEDNITERWCWGAYNTYKRALKLDELPLHAPRLVLQPGALPGEVGEGGQGLL